MGRFEKIVAARQKLCEATVDPATQRRMAQAGVTPTPSAPGTATPGTPGTATPGAPEAQVTAGTQQTPGITQTPGVTNPPTTPPAQVTPTTPVGQTQIPPKVDPNSGLEIDPTTGLPIAKKPTTPPPNGQTPESAAINDINNRMRQYYNGQTPPANSQVR